MCNIHNHINSILVAKYSALPGGEVAELLEHTAACHPLLITTLISITFFTKIITKFLFNYMFSLRTNK